LLKFFPKGDNFIMLVPPKILSISFAALMLVAGSSLAADSSGSGATANVLHVQLDGFRNNNGKAHCTLFNDPEAFPRNEKKALKEAETPTIKNAYAVVDFTGIAPGKYALVCYHDENSNGKFDMSALGLPEEGYAFSNNVKPKLSAPDFDECAFDYKGGEQAISMTMLY
jgi:uncharacterized protein (DUF2141 family)